MAILEAENLKYTYSRGTPFAKQALNGVGFSLERGELAAIIGHTGSGKSTLLQHLNGLLKPDEGDVRFDGKSIWESKASVRNARFNVGLCFQYPEYQLFESTVFKDIAFGPKNMGLSEDEINARVLEAAEHAGLKKSLLEKSPFDLSGGEKRRAAIAGVMAMKPEVLILDEPTAGLDPRGRAEICELIRDYNKTTGSTVVFVSHSMEDVASLAQHVFVMDHGTMPFSGSVSEIFSRADELSSMGLDVPEITRIFSTLRRHGYALPGDVFTPEDGARELLAFLKGGGRVD